MMEVVTDDTCGDTGVDTGCYTQLYALMCIRYDLK